MIQGIRMCLLPEVAIVDSTYRPLKSSAVPWASA